MLAEAVPPGPDSFAVILPVTLFFTPGVMPVTFTEKVQLALDASVPPLSDTLPDPDTAVIVPPPQLPAKPFGVATINPSGRLSVKATPVRAKLILGLFTLNVSEVVPFNGMVGAPNDFAIVGDNATVTVAVAVLPVPPLVDEMVTLLFFTPEVVPLTVKRIEQLLLAASVALDSENWFPLTLPVPVLQV